MQKSDYLWSAYQDSKWPSEDNLEKLVSDPFNTLAVSPELNPVATVLGVGRLEEDEVRENLGQLLERTRGIRSEVQVALRQAISPAVGSVPRKDMEALITGKPAAELPSTGATGGWVSSIRDHFRGNAKVPESTFSGWGMDLLNELYPLKEPPSEQGAEEAAPEGEPLSAKDVWDEIVKNHRFQVMGGDDPMSDMMSSTMYSKVMSEVFADHGPRLIAELTEVFQLGELRAGDFELLSIVMSPEDVQKLRIDHLGSKLVGASLDGKPLDFGPTPKGKRKGKLGINVRIRAEVRGKSSMTALMI